MHSGPSGHRARSWARRLALQALYQIQINPLPWQDAQNQFAEDPEADRVDLECSAGVGNVVNGVTGAAGSSLANVTVANQNLVTGPNPLIGASVVSTTQNNGSVLTTGLLSGNQPLTLKLGGKSLLPGGH